jgi:hypothetical protein
LPGELVDEVFPLMRQVAADGGLKMGVGFVEASERLRG